MKTISVSEAKATLSQQLRHVQRGEEVVITQRGRPVARLVPIAPAEARADLVELERSGLIRRGTGRLSKAFWELPRPTDASGAVRSAVIEERREGQ